MDLTVIVLSFNTKDITNECLCRLQLSVSHLQKKTAKKTEVIVVDNASTDGSSEMIEKKHSFVNLIKSPVNTGFSGGNNLAMRRSKGKYILLLNSDAYLEEDTLTESLKFMEENPESDVLGVKLHFADGRLQPSAGYLPTPLSTILWISGLALIPGIENLYKSYHPKNKNFFKKLREVEWVMGAFMLLKEQVFEKTKGFDENIFMYGEEVEWCKRIKDKGFKTFYNPDISITHLDKASSQFSSEKALLNELKGIKRYYFAHYKNEYSYIKIVILIFIFLRILVFKLLGKKERAKAYFEGLFIV